VATLLIQKVTEQIKIEASTLNPKNTEIAGKGLKYLNLLTKLSACKFVEGLLFVNTLSTLLHAASR